MTTATLTRLVGARAAGRAEATPVAATRRPPSAWFALAGAALMPLGIAAILLGWYGAAHTPYAVEQTPYLISGGLLGLGLVVTGAAFFLGGLVASGVDRHREQTDRIVAALAAATTPAATPTTPAYPGTAAAAAYPGTPATPAFPLTTATPATPVTPTTPAAGHATLAFATAQPAVEALVRTPAGTMAHRPDCPVVARRADVVPVSLDSGVQPCGICSPA